MDKATRDKATKRHQHVFAPPLIAGVSDLPIDGSEGFEDSFQLDKQLASYYHILRHPDTATPLSLAIYGSWGSGKSSAMKWLKKSLDDWTAHVKAPDWEERKEIEPDSDEYRRSFDKYPRLITVDFCPWKYKTDEDLWRGILSEVILAIFNDSKDDVQLGRKLVEVVFRFGGAFGRGILNSIKLKFGGEFKADTGSTNEIKDVAKGKTDARKKGLAVGASALIEWSLKDILDSIRSDLSPQDKHLNVFEEELTNFVKQGLSHNRRLVVFVDDLDRCEPDIAYQMLEAVKLYLNIPGIAFVFGVDEEVLQGHIRKRYLDLGVDQAVKHQGPSADAIHIAEALRVQSPANETTQGEERHTNVAIPDEPERAEIIRKADQYFKKLFSQEILLRPPKVTITDYVERILEVGLKQLDPLQRHHAPEQHDALTLAITTACNRNPREAKRLANIAIAGGLCEIDESTSLEKNTVRFFQGAARKLLSAYFRTKGKLDWTDAGNFEAFLQVWRVMHPYTLEGMFSLRETQVFSTFNALERREFFKHYSAIAVTSEGKPLSNPGPKTPIYALLEGLLTRYSSSDVSMLSIEAFWPFLQDTHLIPVQRLASLIRPPFESPNEPGNASPNDDLVSATLDAQTQIEIDPTNPIWQTVATALGLPSPSDIEIQMLDRIKSLDLSNTAVAELAPLARLNELTTLDLSNTQVGDISAVAKLTALKTLVLAKTNVSDISSVASLAALSTLILANTRVSDLSHLAGLTALSVLDLDNTPVSIITPIAGLDALTSLVLANTDVSDISPLAELTALKILVLSHTQVSDVSPLTALTALTGLDLDNTPVADVSSLSNLTGLATLDLRNTQVNDVSFLGGLSALTRLYLPTSKFSGEQIRTLKSSLVNCHIYI